MWRPPFDPDTVSDEELQRMNMSREQFSALRARTQQEQERTRELNAGMIEERERNTPAIGSVAPDFVLERLSPTGERTGEWVRLSERRGRPVALVFGSFT
jgi:hypothetical protein